MSQRNGPEHHLIDGGRRFGVNASPTTDLRKDSSGWNGGASWVNIGYPGDLGAAVKPVFQHGCSVSGTANYCWSSWCSVQLQTQCDTNHGQSGGPLYGTFGGSPSVIGVVSAGNNVTNKFAGGSLIPTLINNARAAQP